MIWISVFSWINDVSPYLFSLSFVHSFEAGCEVGSSSNRATCCVLLLYWVINLAHACVKPKRHLCVVKARSSKSRTAVVRVSRTALKRVSRIALMRVSANASTESSTELASLACLCSFGSHVFWQAKMRFLSEEISFLIHNVLGSWVAGVGVLLQTVGFQFIRGTLNSPVRWGGPFGERSGRWNDLGPWRTLGARTSDVGPLCWRAVWRGPQECLC